MTTIVTAFREPGRPATFRFTFEGHSWDLWVIGTVDKTATLELTIQGGPTAPALHASGAVRATFSVDSMCADGWSGSHGAAEAWLVQTEAEKAARAEIYAAKWAASQAEAERLGQTSRLRSTPDGIFAIDLTAQPSPPTTGPYGKAPPGLAVTGDNYDPPKAVNLMSISIWTTAEQVLGSNVEGLADHICTLAERMHYIGQAGRGADGCEKRLAQLQERLAAAKVMRGETRMMAVEATLTMEQQIAGAAIRGLTREIVALQNAIIYIEATEDQADRAELIARTGDGEG